MEIASDRSAGEIAAWLRAATINGAARVPGPFGPRPLIYADFTASGRALDFIERAVAEQVLPFYANTHSETSFTGMQTTRYREEAREAIRAAVGADQRHAVIFTGSGATSAVNKLASVIGLRAGEGPEAVVFVGPYEHHSNELIWRESRAKLVRIPLDAEGGIALDVLDRELARHRDTPLKIGAFSAASNVTGVITPLRTLSRMLHANGGWLFADFAAGGPYLPIDMAESAPGAHDGCDAIFLSPHKFIGGPGASGVLVADRRLFGNDVPSVPGGGTVSYVTAATHRYVADIERREEAGTPGIIGDIRAGLAFALKARIGASRIMAMEQAIIARVQRAWADHPAIDLLGPSTAERLAIFSFNIRSGESYLHPTFVVALLNDLFGIQARGGCSCAGPYGHDLLAIDGPRAERLEALVSDGLPLYRPGWVRLNFHFTLDTETIDYILAAVDFIARRGRDLLRLYRADPSSGRWTPIDGERPEAAGFAALCQWDVMDGAAEARQVPCFAECLVAAGLMADRGAAAARPAPEAALGYPERWFAIA